MNTKQKPQHTAGKWEVGIQTYPDTAYYLRECETSKEEIEANARLIASAPELLSMLERIKEAEFGFNASWPTEAEIDSVIKKAKGE